MRKKIDKKSEKRGEERNRKVKVKTAVSLLNPCASTACDIISFYGPGQPVAANLCKVKRSFNPYQNEHNSVKDTGENLVPLLPTYLSFQLILTSSKHF